MKGSELFGVVVRTVGFLIVIYSLWNICAGFETMIENLMSMASDGDSDSVSTFSYFAFGIPGALFGAICFFFADWIVRLAYRGPSA